VFLLQIGYALEWLRLMRLFILLFFSFLVLFSSKSSGLASIWRFFIPFAGIGAVSDFLFVDWQVPYLSSVFFAWSVSGEDSMLIFGLAGTNAVRWDWRLWHLRM